MLAKPDTHVFSFWGMHCHLKIYNYYDIVGFLIALLNIHIRGSQLVNQSQKVDA